MPQGNRILDAERMEIKALFDDQFPTLYRYCLRMTGEPDLAQDVAQEAFVRLVRDDVQGPVPALKAWLFRVASNLVRDRYRVTENRRRLLEINPVAPEPADDVHESLERTETVAAVRRVLEGLPERDRVLLLMREEGFSYAEIAEEIEVKASSVGTLLARAQRRFADAFRESTGDLYHGEMTS
ncbi:sigma-70 family RNA polymerase sigma factor [Gaopeijia maritima]|uniref:Sigma-70 family RNA polymerase sigma factor n=2 Tax=Gaopeijia maritima TaxID=3119007 RepID=A0ABU9EA38_9BACT